MKMQDAPLAHVVTHTAESSIQEKLKLKIHVCP